MRIHCEWTFIFQSIHQSDLTFSTITTYSLLKSICPRDRMATEELSFCLYALPSVLFSTANIHYIIRKSQLKVKVNPLKHITFPWLIFQNNNMFN